MNENLPLVYTEYRHALFTAIFDCPKGNTDMSLKHVNLAQEMLFHNVFDFERRTEICLIDLKCETIKC